MRVARFLVGSIFVAIGVFISVGAYSLWAKTRELNLPRITELGGVVVLMVAGLRLLDSALHPPRSRPPDFPSQPALAVESPTNEVQGG